MKRKKNYKTIARQPLACLFYQYKERIPELSFIASEFTVEIFKKIKKFDLYRNPCEQM